MSVATLALVAARFPLVHAADMFPVPSHIAPCQFGQAFRMPDNAPYWADGFVADLQALNEVAPDVRAERLRHIVKKAAHGASQALLADTRRTLIERRRLQAAFEAPLDGRWGDGLDLFEVFIDHCFNAGGHVNAAYRPAAAARQSHKFDALVRLHGRAVLTAQEVLVLLRGGYSTGAMARWRTLHEVRMVSSLLLDADEELSRRYLAHDDVESMRGEEDYEKDWLALDAEPPDWTAEEREERRAALKTEFGRSFLRDYGWAAALFDDKAPRLKDLEERAGLGHWRSYYRMASHGTHANPKGVTWNIQAGSDVDLIWSGPSDAGLLDPAQCTLIALADVTVGLLGYELNELITGNDALLKQGMTLVAQQETMVLQEQTIDVLAAVHDQQQREEEEVGELIGRVIEILRSSPLMTARAIAVQLGTDRKRIDEALQIAVQRGLLRDDRRYFVSGAEPDEP